MPSDPFESLLLSAYPNPDRQGCPGTPKLREVVENPPAIDDPIAAHIRECSPCFAEFRSFRDTKRALARRKTTLRVAVTSAAIVCAGILWGISGTFRKPLAPPREIAQLDFSNDTAERGTEQSATPIPNIQPTARILTISLPSAADPGIYDVDLRSAARLSISLKPIQTTALQQQTGHFPSLTYQLVPPPLPSGTYAAAWRLHGTVAWHYGFFLIAGNKEPAS